ncbi:MAG: nucleotide sugar dehydrogenase [Paludibacter sp.]|nr:nucleotide sugar dehydrogenase [Paludibacter sp.]
MNFDLHQSTVCVVGAGFVGLPLAKAFGKHLKVIVYDIDDNKIRMLNKENDNINQTFTTDSRQIAKANFVCICVPTPLTKSKQPEMSYVKEASRTIGKNLSKGTVVILESSVYPGVTEEIVKPTLEKESGLKCGFDFKLAYSPERINPGDSEHEVSKVAKIVAANEKETLDLVADLYGIVTSNIFRAKDIKTAEAAKLVENTQRDLNIALVNELSVMFEKMGLSTKDILDAAATKWNFQRFSPGLVGGYCIPVVPYFLVYKAEEYLYHPRVILAGRAINDSMPKHVAEMAVKAINDAGKAINGSKVLIMGCTYKENVSDTRETPARDLIKELLEYKINVWGYDPLVKDGKKDFGIEFTENLSHIPKMDCVILTVAHDNFKNITPSILKNIMNSHPILIDLRGAFDCAEIREGFVYRRL